MILKFRFRRVTALKFWASSWIVPENMKLLDKILLFLSVTVWLLVTVHGLQNDEAILPVETISKDTEIEQSLLDSSVVGETKRRTRRGFFVGSYDYMRPPIDFCYSPARFCHDNCPQEYCDCRRYWPELPFFCRDQTF